MKKYFIAIVLLVFTVSAFSQDNEKQKAYYSELIKKNRTAGRILLYGGAGLIVVPFVISGIAGGDHPLAVGSAYFGFPIGIASMVVSTTYFNRAARYKKKIASISLINQPLEFGGAENRMAGSSTQNVGVPIKNSRHLFSSKHFLQYLTGPGGRIGPDIRFFLCYLVK
jgi:hypothetical protein